MKNAVEKMFDMSLFNSLAYFPDHATNPDKFWEAIEELEEELEIKIDINLICANPSPTQIKISKKFIKEYKKFIMSNPYQWDRVQRIGDGEECVKTFISELTEFHFTAKNFFKAYIESLISEDSNIKAFNVLS